MADKSTNRKINIWINGRQVENTFKGINSAMSKARNELAHMTIGTKEYIKQTKKIKRLQGIMDDHRVKQGQIARGWKKIRNEIKQIAVGNLISNFFTSLAGTVQTAFSKITTSVSDFEGGMTNIFTLLDDRSIEKYGEDLKNGAKGISELGFSMNDVTKSLFDAISAGQDAGDAINFLNEAAILAKGGVTSLSTAVDGSTTIMNAYDLAANEVSNVNAAFFSAQKEGKTTVDELASSIGKAAPIASSLGISYQELLSATAALTKKGISTRMSITYLKAAFANLMKPSKESAAILGKYGVPLGATQIKAVGLTGTLEKLNEVIKQNPDEIARAIPSVEALTAVQALSGKGFEEYQRILESVQSDIGKTSSLQKAYTMQMESLPNIIKQAQDKLTVFAIEIGNKLAPTIKLLIPLISGWTKKTLKLIDVFIKHFQAIKLIAKALTIATATVLAYNIGLKASFFWSKLVALWTNRQAIATNLLRKANLLAALAQAKLTGNTKRAAAAQRTLNITMKANLIGLIIGLLAAAATAYMLFREDVKKATDAQIEFNKAQKEGQDFLNRVKSLESRHKIIKSLNKRQLEDFKAKATEELSILEDKKANFIELHKAEYQERYNLIKKDLKTANEIQKINLMHKLKALDLEVEAKIKAETGMTNEEIKQAKFRLNKYKQVADQRIKLIKQKGDKTGEDKTGGGIEEETNTLEQLLKKYKQLRKEILNVRRKMNLADLSEEEKAIDQIKEKYAGQFEVLNNAITELENIKTKKGKLNTKELELLNKFYNQKKELTELQNAELIESEKSFEGKRIEAKKQVQKRIAEILMDENQKEIHRITEKYKKLIEEAEKYGIDTVELYAKMQKEIDALQKNEKTEQKDIFGMTPDDWEGFFDNVNKAIQIADELGNIISLHNQKIANEEEAKLNKFESSNDKKKILLKQRLDNGLISERFYNSQILSLDLQLEKEKASSAARLAERDKKLRKYQATLDMFSGVSAIWARWAANPVYAGILSGIALVKFGAQLQAINSEPIPAFADGARVNKPTTALIGEAGPEIVLSSSIVNSKQLGPIADDLARIQEGKLPRFLGKPQTPNFNAMNTAISGKSSTDIVNNTVINQVDSENTIKMKNEITQMREDISKMTNAVSELKYLRAIITNDDLKENDVEEKLRLRYSSF